VNEKVAAPVYKTEINDRGGSAALTARHGLLVRVGTNLADTAAVARSV
jgi:hypothetical protein